MSQVVGLPNNSYRPITNTAWVRARLCKLQKGCIRLAAASDKVYQLLAHGRWFSSGTPASSTTKTGRHDITTILLKMAFNTKNQIKSNQNLNKIRQRLYFITKGVTIPYLRLPGLCQKCGKLYESTYSTVLLDGYNMYSIQHYVNKFVSEFRPMVFFGYSGFLHQ